MINLNDIITYFLSFFLPSVNNDLKIQKTLYQKILKEEEIHSNLNDNYLDF